MTLRGRVILGALVLISALAGVQAYLFWYHTREDYLSKQAMRLLHLMQNKEIVLQDGILAAERSGRFLASTSALKAFVEETREPDADSRSVRDRLTQLFEAYARVNPGYFQIRLVGVAYHGRELIRVEQSDGRVHVVPEHALQEKGDRPYIRQGMTLAPGQIYLSPINLNREHGKVQVPHKPTLRVVVPVFDAHGARFGMVVINVLVEPFLAHLQQNLPEGTKAFLANSDGSFLVHPQADRSFGFDLGHDYRLTPSMRALMPVVTFSVPSVTASSGQTDVENAGTPKLGKVHSVLGDLYALSGRVQYDPDDPARFLTLVFGQPVRNVQAAIVARAQPMLLSILFGGLLLIAMAVFLLIRVFSPLRELALVAQRVGKGDYEFPLPAVRGAEMSTFIEAFDEMRSDIRCREAENRHLTQELQDSEAFARAVVDAMPEGVLVIDPAGRVVRANNNACSMFACALPDLIGRTVEELIPERYRSGHMTLRARYEAKPSLRTMGQEYELYAQRSDGSEFPVDVALGPMRQRDCDYVTVTITDVTQRKEAEEALRRSEERFRLMVDNVRDYSFLLLDPDGVVLTWNEGAQRLHGYVAAEIVGHSFNCLYDPAAVKKGVPQELLATARREGAARDEGWRIRKDGSRFYAEVVFMAMRDSQGSLIGFTKIDHDLTQRKMVESELQEARDVADRANQAKSEFLANMSHEIRTPLNGVIGLVQLLQDTPLNSRQRDYLQKLRGASRALLKILNDILDYSKIEAGRLDLELAPFDLYELLDTTVGLFSFLAEEKGVELILDVPIDVPRHLLGDGMRLSQVLNNLVGNAVKFTERGEVLIRVSVQAGSDNEVKLNFTVRDTGIGMTRDQLDELFRPFQQLDASITRQYGGTGLGLVIAQRLAELMSGRIEVASTLGEGSTFWFSIRLGKWPASDLDVGAREPGQLRPMKVLAVDDNPTALTILSELLKGWGMQVLTARNARSGLSLAQNAERGGEPVELFLIDWRMPELDGVAMAQQIQDMVKRGDVSKAPMVVMVTAFGQQHVRQAAQEVILDAVLDKPVTASRLFDLLITVQHQRDQPKAVLAPEREQHLQGRAEGIRGARVLLVEDNPTNQFVARSFLDKLGLQVDLADNGLVAVEQVERNPYDAILMDLQMPVMDGLEATRRIRALPDKGFVPIIAMTAAAFDSDRKATEEAGMNAHVTKPINLDELTSVLVQWIKPHSVEHMTGDATPVSENDRGQPFKVSGLDAETAVRGLDNDWALLRQVLAGFLRDFRTAPDQVKALAEQNRWSDVRRLAHTIKGLASNIGAIELAEEASAFERALRQLPDKAEHLPVEEQARFLARLHETLSALSAFFDAQGVEEERGAADLETTEAAGNDEECRQLLRDLSGLLRQSTIVPHRFKDRLLSLLRHRVDEALIKQLFAQIGALDYEQAERTVDEIIQLIDR